MYFYFFIFSDVLTTHFGLARRDDALDKHTHEKDDGTVSCYKDGDFGSTGKNHYVILINKQCGSLQCVIPKECTDD